MWPRGASGDGGGRDQAARRAALNALSAPESGRALHEPFFDQAAVRPDAVALLGMIDAGELDTAELAEWWNHETAPN